MRPDREQDSRRTPRRASTPCAGSWTPRTRTGLVARVVGDWADGPVNYLNGTRLQPGNGRRVPSGPPLWARWNLRTGEVREIPAGPQNTGARALLADGRVAINIADGAVLWTDAGSTSLPVPGGYHRVQVTGAGAGGMVVGTATDRAEKTVAVRWNCG
jgi:hypothetical protein